MALKETAREYLLEKRAFDYRKALDSNILGKAAKSKYFPWVGGAALGASAYAAGRHLFKSKKVEDPYGDTF